MNEEVQKLHDFIEVLSGKFVDICWKLVEEKAKVKSLEEENLRLTKQLEDLENPHNES